MRTLITAMLLAVCFAACAYGAPRQIGLVVSMQGTATATSPDNTSRALHLKSPVYANDRIVTGAGSKLQLLFDDDSVVAQGESSTLVIDKYVYDPKQKEEGSCSLDMVKGFFRVVTGSITRANPDRFKARTRLATIGIRGCELGFSLQEKQEDIYVLELPKGKRIDIGRIPTQEELKQKRRRYLDDMVTIAQAGIAVQVREGMPLTKRGIDPKEAQQFIQGAVLKPAPGGKKQSGEGGKAGVQQSSRGTRDRIDAAVAQSDETQRQVGENDVRERGIAGLQPNTSAAPQEPPPVIRVTEPRLALVGGSPLDDWEWAIWEDGRTEYYANRTTESAFLTPDEYRAIADSAIYLDLTGTGTAGAVVKNNGATKTMQGSCELNVRIGQGVTPGWDGAFHLGNSDGDSLNFGVAGTVIDGNLSGQLEPARTTYRLRVDGTVFSSGSITRQSVNGRLIHPPSGATRISAAAGTYLFEHSGGLTSVHGAFGAPLYEPQ